MLEDSLKILFDRWMDDKLPKLKEELRSEVILDVGAKAQQTSFNQKEMARRQGVSVTTFKKWREKGLQSEPSPTGKLLFDLNKVNEWREENDCRKEK